MYAETVIHRCHSGFNMYQNGEHGEEWEFEADLLDAMGKNVELFELGIDDLPKGMDDIRGHIENEPDRIFVFISDYDNTVCYAGISKV